MKKFKRVDKAEFVYVVGEIAPYVTIERCCVCGNLFILSNDDFLKRNGGVVVKANDPDKSFVSGRDNGWCCDECVAEVKRIKNLGSSD